MNIDRTERVVIFIFVFLAMHISYAIADRKFKNVNYFDYMGDCLLLFTAGITSYYIPNVIYGISYETINTILQADDVNAILDLLKQLELLETTAKEVVQEIKVISIIIGVIIDVIAVCSLVAKSQIRQKKNFENKNTTQIGNING